MNGSNIAWLDGLNVRGIRPGLESITELLDALGNPQEGLRMIHVAGSDGKGSVCCMIESILFESGMRTGMFTSPQIIDVNECIRISKQPIDDDTFERMLGKVREAAERIDCPCTNFEALTACALLTFRELGCDIAVIEVGMGGRLDSTNVITPEVTVINNISLEHTQYLGSTLKEIAAEKAGIMKPNVPCVTVTTGDALEIIKARASELGCPFTVVISDSVRVRENHSDHIIMEFGGREYTVGLPGRFQGRNAAIAIEAVSLLKNNQRIMGSVDAGLSNAYWPARMEKLKGSNIILDVTHTKAGALCLRSDIEEIYGKVVLVTAMLSDKDLDGVAEILSPIARKVLVSAPNSPRAADAEELASHYRKHIDDVTVFPTVADAMEAAVREEGYILVTGSFRTAEDCLRWLKRTE